MRALRSKSRHRPRRPAGGGQPESTTMIPFFDTHCDQWVFIPTFVVEAGECQCCGGGATFVGIVFLCWSVGVLIQAEDHEA